MIWKLPRGTYKEFRKLRSHTITFDEIIVDAKGHTTGFDYLRILLALAVLGVHVLSLSNPAAWAFLWHSYLSPIELGILPAFFVLSGFLVTGSLLRNTIPQFLLLRALRIIPALAVEVTLSAIFLGALVTLLPLRQYIVAPEFRAYFLNIVGYIHYTLPGVYGGRPINLQLWTVPFELECYIALVILAVVGLVERKYLLLVITSAAIFFITMLALHRSFYHANWNVPGRMLVVSFLAGVLGYLFRSSIPHSRLVFLASIAAAYIFLRFPNLVFVGALPLAYLTIYIGLLRPPRIPFGDLSYGIYLFHYPIARSIYESTGRNMNWELLLFLTILLSTGFAALSWLCVESPILDRKAKILSVLRWRPSWQPNCKPGSGT